LGGEAAAAADRKTGTHQAAKRRHLPGREKGHRKNKIARYSSNACGIT
jgi:hypothetical protein